MVWNFSLKWKIRLFHSLAEISDCGRDLKFGREFQTIKNHQNYGSGEIFCPRREFPIRSIFKTEIIRTKIVDWGVFYPTNQLPFFSWLKWISPWLPGQQFRANPHAFVPWLCKLDLSFHRGNRGCRVLGFGDLSGFLVGFLVPLNDGGIGSIFHPPAFFTPQKARNISGI